MLLKSTTLLVFLLATGCAAQPPRVSAGPPLGRNEPVRAGAPAIEPHEAAAEREQPPRSRAGLELPPSAGFDDERQVAQLRTAIALYTQFLERAEGRPELAPAVKKARERIEDAQQTIVFLQSAPR